MRCFPSFKYGNDIIEVVSDYVYSSVNINFNNKNSFIKIVEHNGIYLKIYIKMAMPNDIQCDFYILLFRSML